MCQRSRVGTVVPDDDKVIASCDELCTRFRDEVALHEIFIQRQSETGSVRHSDKSVGASLEFFHGSIMAHW
jgi:hypothetical protein